MVEAAVEAPLDVRRVIKHRTLFISDVHLGTRTCQAEILLDFLKHNHADRIYLVGDIIDFWRIKRGAIWPQNHNDVVQKLLKAVRKGTEIIFVPGNHDEGLRDYCGMQFGGIRIERHAIHATADGRRLLILHGDEYDVVMRYAKWLAFMGDRSYELLLWMNTPLNWIRRRFGFGYWSLSKYLKYRVKTAVNFIGEFEEALAEEARHRGLDGVVCGHIHHVANREIDGVQYLNCGDWVESCSALSESYSGEINIIHWVTLPVEVQSTDQLEPKIAA